MMAARRRKYLSPDEYLRVLQQISDDESEVEESNMDDVVSYECLENIEKNSSSGSEESVDKQATDRDIQPVRISSSAEAGKKNISLLFPFLLCFDFEELDFLKNINDKNVRIVIFIFLNFRF